MVVARAILLAGCGAVLLAMGSAAEGPHDITVGDGVTTLCGSNGVPCPQGQPRNQTIPTSPSPHQPVAPPCPYKDPRLCNPKRQLPPDGGVSNPGAADLGGQGAGEPVPGDASGRSGPSASESAATQQTLSDSGGRAMSDASRLGNTFTSSLNAVDSMPDLGPAAGAGMDGAHPQGAAPAGMPGVGATAGGDPASPRTVQDMVAASRSGFSGSFQSLDLRVGQLPAGGMGILRRDGQPASQGEMVRLAQRIQSEPTALMRRPDFYSVISRDDFYSLKKEYLTHPERGENEFKHITMPQSQRDFLRSQSCQRISGSCNLYTTQMHYRRGEYVPPEDLSVIWTKIKHDAEKEKRRSNEASGMLSTDFVKRKLAGSIFGRSLAARLRGMIRLGAFSDAEAPSGMVAIGAAAPVYREASAAKAKVVFSGPAPQRRRAQAPPRPGEEELPAAPKLSRMWLPIGMCVAGGALLIFGLRRRRGRPFVAPGKQED
jgi:hypothetical protein